MGPPLVWWQHPHVVCTAGGCGGEVDAEDHQRARAQQPQQWQGAERHHAVHAPELRQDRLASRPNLQEVGVN